MKSISVSSANWEEGLIIRTFISLVTIVILLELRDPFHARVAIPKAGKMGRQLGNRRLMPNWHAERKSNRKNAVY